MEFVYVVIAHAEPYGAGVREACVIGVYSSEELAQDAINESDPDRSYEISTHSID